MRSRQSAARWSARLCGRLPAIARPTCRATAASEARSSRSWTAPDATPSECGQASSSSISGDASRDLLDRKALEIGFGVLRVEDLAVEERLLAARLARRRRDTQCLRRLAPEILAIDLGDQRLGVEVHRLIAPAL